MPAQRATSTTLAQRPPLTTLARLASYVDHSGGMHGVQNARRALRYAFDRSRSPVETSLALLLGLPPLLGGYSLDGFELNRTASIDGRTDRASAWRSHECDLLWQRQRVALEYDSNAHHAREADHVRDAKKRAALIGARFTVITVTRAQLYDYREFHKVAQALARALHVRLPRATAEFTRRQFETRRILLNPAGILRTSFPPNMWSVYAKD